MMVASRALGRLSGASPAPSRKYTLSPSLNLAMRPPVGDMIAWTRCKGTANETTLPQPSTHTTRAGVRSSLRIRRLFLDPRIQERRPVPPSMRGEVFQPWLPDFIADRVVKIDGQCLAIDELGDRANDLLTLRNVYLTSLRF